MSHSAFPIASRSFIGFGGRIILIVLAILLLSQTLGTLLSVLTFEKYYIKALTSKYEVLGKDLKRNKIEQSLKFGKSLDKFVGMDRLVEPLFLQNEDLNEVFLADPYGNIFFRQAKSEVVVAQAVTETGIEKKVLLSQLKDNENNTFPADELFDWNHEGTTIRLYKDRYYILFPIIPPYGGQKGILGLVFKRSVVDEKKIALIKSSRNKLIISLFLTAVIIGFLINYFFINPTRQQVRLMTNQLQSNRNTEAIKHVVVSEEVQEIQISTTRYLAYAQSSRQELKKALDKLEESTPNTTANFEIHLMKDVLEGKQDE